MSDSLALFVTASRGIEPLLVDELRALGAADVKPQGGGVACAADLAGAYRICLWSRLASRVLLPLSRFPIADAEALYRGARQLEWFDVFGQDTTFAIEVAGRSPAVTHTHYAGLKVKDAIVDTFRGKTGARPSVDTENPGLRIHLHLDREEVTLSLDLSGESLHRRGYRRAGSEAPLKENLAAAILARAGWPALARDGAPLIDPMCGSGTLVIEAALIAGDVAPGLARPRFGFEAWLEHKPKVWRELREEAQARATAGLVRELPPMAGFDIDAGAIRAATDNARRAQVADKVTFARQDLSLARPRGDRPGLVVTNPPYGERLGAEAEVIKIHSLLGAALKEHFPGWQAAVFTGRPDLGPRIGLRAKDTFAMYNGPIACKLLRFDVPGGVVAVASGAATASARADATAASTSTSTKQDEPAPRSATPLGGADFSNRLQKNTKHLAKWAKRTGVSCYRLYDADLPDYAVAVDLYESAQRHVHVQEYAAPKTVDPVKAEKRLREALTHIQQQLEVPAASLHYKLRRAQRPGAQYSRQAETGVFHEIDEHGCRLRVNFDDYLDTGLFLDHRALRRRIQQEAAGKRFLNLFCYTGSATAHAARGGAKQTLSIDLSNTYLEWAQQNLRLNDVRAELFDHPPAPRAPGGPPNWPAHALLRADCLKWLDAQAESRHRPSFDLILCDPPTFSHSKKMEGVLDVQRDHVALIRQCVALLAPGGVLYFSTNRRGFKLDAEALKELQLRDITAQTLDEDFRRLPPPPAHRCWRITA